jgi:ribosomal protein S18 acetylase RimI-like enzyme
MQDIVFTARPATEAEIALTLAGLDQASFEAGAPKHEKELFGLQAWHASELIGSLTGNITWDWLHIDFLWVDAAHQKTGIGTRLMEQAETAARAKNLIGIWCATHSWQAPEFYKKLGFTEFTRFDDFPRGHQRIGFRKYL